MNASIQILAHGRPLRLHYGALLEYHGGGALAGAAIGFRAMQCAGELLSTVRTWDRNDLAVVSWHSGPGVRDAIEFVTHAITRRRFELRETVGANNCASASAFRFEVGDGRRAVHVQLREGLLPTEFFALAENSNRGTGEDAELARLKTEVATAVMRQSLQALFEIAVRESACA